MVHIGACEYYTMVHRSCSQGSTWKKKSLRINCLNGSFLRSPTSLSYQCFFEVVNISLVNDVSVKGGNPWCVWLLSDKQGSLPLSNV